MSKVEVDLQNLSLLDKEIELREKRKKSLDAELEELSKKCNTLLSDTDKEIAQKKQDCDNECQEKINQANKLLKTAEDKLKTADGREEASKIIEEQQARLSEAIKDFSNEQKSAETLKITLLEKERKADLLIEQYTKKLEELGVTPKEVIKEEPKEEIKNKKKK